MITGFHHVSVPARNLGESVSFYTSILGFDAVERPDHLPSNGVWLEGHGFQLHLIEDPSYHGVGLGNTLLPDKRHFAVSVPNAILFRTYLAEHGVPLSDLMPLSNGAQQFFFADPAGTPIEVNDIKKENLPATTYASHPLSASEFSPAEQDAVYRAIFERRDVRENYLPDPIPEKLLARLLVSAHHAPSVGFMQPWDFILIEDIDTRRAVKEIFLKANANAAGRYSGEQAERYRSLKLESILETPLNICVTCDRARGGENVVGRDTIRDTDLYSVAMAVQNLWLAARSEGVGVCWVSVFEPNELKNLLELPGQVIPVAYLCLGFVRNFPTEPDLQAKKWRKRLSLRELIHHNKWSSQGADLRLYQEIDKLF